MASDWEIKTRENEDSNVIGKFGLSKQKWIETKPKGSELHLLSIAFLVF